MATAAKPANRQPTGKRGGKTSTSWKKGQPSPNPAGAPKRGESWAEIFKALGDMTPAAAADFCRTIAGQLKTLGGGITLKQAVVLRVYAALLSEPTSGLLNSVMDRVEGKVSQPIDLTWRDPWIEMIRTGRATFQQVSDELDQSLAAELFAAAGVPVDHNDDAA